MRGACPICLREPCSGSVWDAHPHSLSGINRTEPLTRLSISLIIKHLSQYVPQARLIAGEEVHRATHGIMGDSERGQIRKDEHLPTGLLQDLLTEVGKDSCSTSHVRCFKSKFRCVCMQVCLSSCTHACFYWKGLRKLNIPINLSKWINFKLNKCCDHKRIKSGHINMISQ